ncbi:hypothetical protein RI129_008673 [Pyrocoelia pectoralis]|uniref:Fas-binding factor 1 C-terminal domain-containing protein n=1 Tax=Pyrocoelia pectoralis TaxID=417401 RepID=A0AAN7VBJ3_9COLE
MAQFAEQDLLADLHSDDSNDSFFEEPKVTSNKPSVAKPPDKKAISNLFGLSDDKPKNKKADWLGLEADESDQPKASKEKKKISFDDEDDILNDLGIDKKPVVSEPSKDKTPISSAKKSSLMESIFGPPKSSQNDSLEGLLKTSTKPHSSPVRSATKPHSSAVYDMGSASREGRRSRHSAGTTKTLDPLGLFSTDTEHEDLNASKNEKRSHGEGEVVYESKTLPPKPKSAPNIHNFPDWLEGSPVKVQKSDVVIPRPRIDQQPTVQRAETPHVEFNENEEQTNFSSTILAQQGLLSAHLDYQNTSATLQQQESQVLMALQLKKCEEYFAQTQRKQLDILMKQEQQFSEMLGKQFAKQQMMENNMRMQQERINNNIQLLLSQPTSPGNITIDQEEEINQLRKSNSEQNAKLYEEMIEILKQRQHEETFLLNESYKKQINIIENSMESVESRLKAEVTNLSGQFEKTIETLRAEHEIELTKYKQKLQEMTTMHGGEIQQIRENHNRIIDEIKYEYSTMIENLKQVKQTENSLVENASTYTQKLESSLEALGVNNNILNEIRGKVHSEYNILTRAREESFKAKEEEIKMMRVALEKARETADAERVELMSLVRNLETKLVEQIQNTKEERWALKQSAGLLMARTTAFDREMEFARSSLEREREQLQTFKEQLLAEQSNQIQQITEEKLRISAEKSRLETAAKLSQNYDLDRNKVEIEAAIQVAKEAAERTDQERKKLHAQQAEVESLKRSLADQQYQLSLKEQQLQQLMLKADQKAKNGEQALMDAKVLEDNCHTRLRDIQTQLISLRNQEKKLAQEKVMLLREQNNLKRTKKCSLCNNGNMLDDTNVLIDAAEQDFSPRIFAVTDPDIVRLRYEINEEVLPVPIQSEENDENK